MEGQLDWKLGACWRPRLSSWWELLNRPWCFCAECKYLQPDVRPWAVLGEGVAPRVQVLPLWVHIFFFSPSTLSMARKPAGMSRSCDQGLCGECPRRSPCSWLGALCSGSEVERVTQKNTLRCAWSPALRRRGLFSPVSHPSPALRTSHICFPSFTKSCPLFLQNMNLPLTAAPGPGATTLPRATVSSPGPSLLLDMEAIDIL